ncbi:DUF6478 family protein [Tabrizicola sp.]|uniref:DUF6478 family protein n=1 Tax=Tabrizicola sp. TaxID=2005166 RepID=UPI0035B33156
MAGRVAQALDRWILRRVQGRWTRANADAPELDLFELRALRAEARAMRRQIDRLLHAADARLSRPLADGREWPLGTDWTWRPDGWRGPLPDPGEVIAGPASQLSEDLGLYHDCPLSEIAFRQLRNTESHAPFGLALEVFGFRGSFLSLSLGLPESAATGLGPRHVLRLDAAIEADRPLRAFARLNLRHSAGLAQQTCDLTRGGEAEFDLAYAGLGEARIERAWLDLIFNDAAMTRILLRDAVLSRRPRAGL